MCEGRREQARETTYYVFDTTFLFGVQPTLTSFSLRRRPTGWLGRSSINNLARTFFRVHIHTYVHSLHWKPCDRAAVPTHPKHHRSSSANETRPANSIRHNRPLSKLSYCTRGSCFLEKSCEVFIYARWVLV